MPAPTTSTAPSPRRGPPSPAGPRPSIEDRKAALTAMGQSDHGQRRRLQAPAHRRTGQAAHAEAEGEVMGAGYWLMGAASLDLPVTVNEDSDERYSETRHVLLGVGRRDRAVELPAAARDVQGRPRVAGGQHHGAQTLALHAAHRPEIRRAGQGHAAARRAQHRHRWRRARPMDDAPSRASTRSASPDRPRPGGA